MSQKQWYQGEEPLFVLLWTAGLSHTVKDREELTTSQGSSEPLRELGGGQWARREVQGKEMGKRPGGKGEREQSAADFRVSRE